MKKALRNIRLTILGIRVAYLRKVKGMTIGRGTLLSMKAVLDRSNPKGIKIGCESYVAFGAVILTHDFVRSFHVTTEIGSRTFIGANSIVMPGVKVGSNCIVGAGSVVTKDVPNNCVVAGNPARIIKEGISVTRFGKIIHG